MPNENKAYLEDILSAIENIENYTKGLDCVKFAKNKLIADAVLRNLEIIGEAVKKLPSDLKQKHPEIEWKKIAGLRDIIIHEYFGVNMDIIWDVVANKLPKLKDSIRRIKDGV